MNINKEYKDWQTACY